MLQEFAFTPATLIAVLVIVALSFLAIRRLLKRGMCDCGDHCDGCSKKKGGNACKMCSAANDMVARMEKDADMRLGGHKTG